MVSAERASADIIHSDDVIINGGSLAVGFDGEGSALLDEATIHGARVVPGDDASWAAC